MVKITQTCKTAPFCDLCDRERGVFQITAGDVDTEGVQIIDKADTEPLVEHPVYRRFADMDAFCQDLCVEGAVIFLMDDLNTFGK